MRTQLSETTKLAAGHMTWTLLDSVAIHPLTSPGVSMACNSVDEAWAVHTAMLGIDAWPVIVQT